MIDNYGELMTAATLAKMMNNLLPDSYCMEPFVFAMPGIPVSFTLCYEQRNRYGSNSLKLSCYLLFISLCISERYNAKNVG